MTVNGVVGAYDPPKPPPRRPDSAATNSAKSAVKYHSADMLGWRLRSAIRQNHREPAGGEAHDSLWPWI